MKISVRQLETGYSICRKVFCALVAVNRDTAKRFQRRVNTEATVGEDQLPCVTFNPHTVTKIAASYGVRVVRG